jgi:hypothetical protein
MNFWSELFATFIGAVFAFLFALFLYMYQRKTNEGCYLSFVISYTSSQISALYSFKKDHIQSRKSEIERLESQFSGLNNQNRNESLSLELRHISMFIVNPSHSYGAVNLEKLNFIADYDPNLFALMKAAFDADSGVNEIIEGCNDQIQYTKQDLDLSNIWILISYNKELAEQVDYSLALLEHAQEQLIKFAKSEFTHFVKISGFEILDEYKKYKPDIQNTWTKFEYTAPERSPREKIVNRLKRLTTCW